MQVRVCGGKKIQNANEYNCDAGPIYSPEFIESDILLCELKDRNEIIIRDLAPRQRELLSGILPSPGEDLLDEPARWVYFPWRATVISLLGPRGFRRLRLDRNRNKLTASEQDNFQSKTVGVVGLSVGHVIAHTFALEGLVGELRLADFDEIELSNMNRIPSSLLDLGLNKAIVTARRVAELDPYLRVEVFTDGITRENIDRFISGLDIVYEESDSFDVKLLVREIARQHRIPVIMESSDGGVIDVERFDINPARPLFHGILPESDLGASGEFGPDKRMELAARLMDVSTLTPRMAASALDVGVTIGSWPQLGSDVILGGASSAAALRRWGLGGHLPSGRTRVDLEAALDGLIDPLDTPRFHTPRSDMPPSGLGPTLLSAAPVSVSSREDRLRVVIGHAPSWASARIAVINAGDRLSLIIRPVPEEGNRLDIAGRAGATTLGAAIACVREAGDRLDPASMEMTNGKMLSVRIELSSGADGDRRIPATVTDVTGRRAIGNGVPLTAAQRNHVVIGNAALIDTPDDLAKVGHLIGGGERVGFLTSSLRQVVADTVFDLNRPYPPEHDFGEQMLLKALSRPEVLDLVGEWGGGTMLAARTVRKITTSAALVLIPAGPVGEPALADYVDAGRVAGEVILAARRIGLRAEPITPLWLYARSSEEVDAIAPEARDELVGMWSQWRAVVGDNLIAAIVRVFTF